MPKEGYFAGVLAHTIEQLLGKEVCLILVEVHIIGVAQRAIHNCEGVQGERSKRHSLRVDPANRAGGLQAEAGTIGERHSEIIGEAQINETLHILAFRPSAGKP